LRVCLRNREMKLFSQKTFFSKIFIFKLLSKMHFDHFETFFTLKSVLNSFYQLSIFF
jgi:hypothetical protein